MTSLMLTCYLIFVTTLTDSGESLGVALGSDALLVRRRVIGGRCIGGRRFRWA